MKTENFDFKKHPLYGSYMALFIQAVKNDLLFYSKEHQMFFTPSELVRKWKRGFLLFPLDQWALVSELEATAKFTIQIEHHKQKAELYQTCLDDFLIRNRKENKKAKPNNNE